jgi:hypothetical protein
MQHVDVIVTSGHAKKSVQNLEGMIYHSLKYHTALSSVVLYIPCQVNEQFFQPQCMQSMLPSIPGNPLAELCAII